MARAGLLNWFETDPALTSHVSNLLPPTTPPCHHLKEPPTLDYNSPHDSYDLGPDQPIPLKPPRPLEQVQCFLKEDIRQIAFREPDNYKAWCITADHSLMKADDTDAIFISRGRVRPMPPTSHMS